MDPEQILIIMTYMIYLLYILFLFGLAEYAPNYIDELTFIMQILVGLLLVYYFSPISPQIDKLSSFHITLAFRAGVLLLLTILSPIIKIYLVPKLNSVKKHTNLKKIL